MYRFEELLEKGLWGIAMHDVTSGTLADAQLGRVEAEVLQAEKIDCRAKRSTDRT